MTYAPQIDLENRGRLIEEWRAGWLLVTACAMGMSMSGLSTTSLGLAMEPLQREFGWNRATVSLATLVPAVILVLFSPVVGAVIDRWGSRTLAIISVGLTGCALALISTANGAIGQWIGLWLLYAFVGLGTKMTVWTAAVSGAFTTGRGLALGVMMTGSALVQVLIPPIMRMLVDDHGWRTAYVVMGLGWSLPVLVLVIIGMRDPRQAQRLAADAEGRQEAVGGLTFGQALRNLPLIRIGLSTLLTMTVGTAIMVHQVPILTETGISRTDAALLASLAGVAAIVGKLATGWMSDRWDAVAISALTMLAPALAFVLLLVSSGQMAPTLVAMVIIGYTTGAKLQISAFLTGRYGGLSNFGKIFGVMASLIGLGAGLGSVIAGAIFDLYGNYDPLLVAGVVCSIICAALLFRLGEPES
jgi:predicted MFS family arabinose efflux permease